MQQFKREYLHQNDYVEFYENSDMLELQLKNMTLKFFEKNKDKFLNISMTEARYYKNLVKPHKV
ncbi:hypothetical protein [Helicobacter sp. T3_23-1056]